MYGGIVCVAVTSTVSVIDLTTMAGDPARGQGQAAQGTQTGDNANPNPLGHFLTLVADGSVSIYVGFFDTYAHAAAASTSATTALQANTNDSNNVDALVSSFTATGTIPIPAGGSMTAKLPAGALAQVSPTGGKSPGRFLAVLTASGTATLRMWQSSP